MFKKQEKGGGDVELRVVRQHRRDRALVRPWVSKLSIGFRGLGEEFRVEGLRVLGFDRGLGFWVSIRFRGDRSSSFRSGSG